MEKVLAAVAVVFVFLGLAFLLSLIAGIPVYFLWNWLVPDLFGIRVISFWEAVGITMLARCLVGSSSSSKSKD